MTNFDPTTATLAETPIRRYGVLDVSRPLAAALLGMSRKGLNNQLQAGRIEAAGEVQKRIPVAELEAVAGRTVTVHEYLTALMGRAPAGNRHAAGEE